MVQKGGGGPGAREHVHGLYTQHARGCSEAMHSNQSGRPRSQVPAWAHVPGVCSSTLVSGRKPTSMAPEPSPRLHAGVCARGSVDAIIRAACSCAHLRASNCAFRCLTTRAACAAGARGDAGGCIWCRRLSTLCRRRARLAKVFVTSRLPTASGTSNRYVRRDYSAAHVHATCGPECSGLGFSLGSSL